jgi:hypothetical protein
MRPKTTSAFKRTADQQSSQFSLRTALIVIALISGLAALFSYKVYIYPALLAIWVIFLMSRSLSPANRTERWLIVAISTLLTSLIFFGVWISLSTQ